MDIERRRLGPSIKELERQLASEREGRRKAEARAAELTRTVRKLRAAAWYWRAKAAPAEAAELERRA